MKKVILVLALLGLVTPAFAGNHHQVAGPQGPQGIQGEKGDQGVAGPVGESASSRSNNFGAKLDAPYLARINDNWFVGVEGGKDLNYSNASQGWFAYGKVTYVGTLINKNQEYK